MSKLSMIEHLSISFAVIPLYIAARYVFPNQEQGIALMIVGIAAFNVFYFGLYALEKLSEILSRPQDFRKWVVAVCGIIALLVIAFACNYLCLHHLDKASFSGISEGVTVRSGVDFLYFSIVTFATVGYGDIHAIGVGARCLVALEIITSFIFLVFILGQSYHIHASLTWKSSHNRPQSELPNCNSDEER